MLVDRHHVGAGVVELHVRSNGRHDKALVLNVCLCCVLVALHQITRVQRSSNWISSVQWHLHLATCSTPQWPADREGKPMRTVTCVASVLRSNRFITKLLNKCNYDQLTNNHHQSHTNISFEDLTAYCLV